jgi:hypothetical protein
MNIIRHHALLRIIKIKTISRGLGEVLIIIALELNLAVIAVNLPAIRSIWVKREQDRKKEVLSGKYSGTTTRSQTARSQTINTSLGAGRPRERHEMIQLSNTARDSPLSDSQGGFGGLLRTVLRRCRVSIKRSRGMSSSRRCSYSGDR